METCLRWVRRALEVLTVASGSRRALRGYGWSTGSSDGRRLPLASRAERRRPEIDRVRRHELLATPHARLARAPVYLQLELEPAPPARAGAVVPHRRAR